MPKLRYELNDVEYSDIRYIKKTLGKLGAIQVSSGSRKDRTHYIFFSVKELGRVKDIKSAYPNIIELRQ